MAAGHLLGFYPFERVLRRPGGTELRRGKRGGACRCGRPRRAPAPCQQPPDRPIYFGILTFLGTAVLATLALEGLLRRVPARAGLAGSLLLFLLLRDLNFERLGFEGIRLADLPGGWYRYGLPGTFFGFQQANLPMADYYSLLPWLFLFWGGYYACRPGSAAPWSPSPGQAGTACSCTCFTSPSSTACWPCGSGDGRAGTGRPIQAGSARFPRGGLHIPEILRKNPRVRGKTSSCKNIDKSVQ